MILHLSQASSFSVWYRRKLQKSSFQTWKTNQLIKMRQGKKNSMFVLESRLFSFHWVYQTGPISLKAGARGRKW